jgi:hypothetical protein
LLFQPSHLGLDLDCNRDVGFAIVDHQIDDATNGSIDRHLQHPGPARMEDPDKRLDDPCLDVIS